MQAYSTLPNSFLNPFLLAHNSTVTVRVGGGEFGNLKFTIQILNLKNEEKVFGMIFLSSTFYNPLH